MSKSNFFSDIRKYLKGKLSKEQLRHSDSSIRQIYEDVNNKGLTEILFDFDDRNILLKMLGLNDDDIYFYNAVNSPYETYEFVEYYTVKDDFLDGYGVWGVFNSDNEELLKRIANFGFSKKFEIDNMESRQELAKLLIDTFPDQTESIIQDYTNEKNYEMNQTASDYMEDEINQEKKNLGLNTKGGTNNFKMTIQEISNLYLQNFDIDLTFEELLEKTHEYKESSIGGWWEDPYSFSDDANFNTDRFNRDAEWQLEKILDEIMDDEEFPKYLETVKEITKRFNYDTWYQLPKKSSVAFRINGIDRDSSKIQVSLRKKENNDMRNIKVSLENFYNLLYQPELFNFDELYSF